MWPHTEENGIADAAMLKFHSVAKVLVLTPVFEDMYRCNPAEYFEQNEITMLMWMLAYEATIMRVKKNNKLNASAALREGNEEDSDCEYEGDQNAPPEAVHYVDKDKDCVEYTELYPNPSFAS